MKNALSLNLMCDLEHALKDMGLSYDTSFHCGEQLCEVFSKSIYLNPSDSTADTKIIKAGQTDERTD